MGLLDSVTSFFKKPEKVSYAESTLRSPVEEQFKSLIPEIGAVKSFAPTDTTSALRPSVTTGIEKAISGVMGQKPYSGAIETPASGLITQGAGIAAERAGVAPETLGAETYDKYMEDVLAAYDIETPEFAKPILESNVGTGTLTSGAGKTDVGRYLTERATGRAQLVSGLGKEKLEFQKGEREYKDKVIQQNLENLYKYGTQEEARTASNIANKANMYFMNQGLSTEQANTLSTMMASLVLPEERQRFTELLEEWDRNKNLPLEKAQELERIMSTILNEEGARTEVAAYNAKRLSPFTQAMQAGMAGSIAGITGGTAAPMEEGQTQQQGLLSKLASGISGLFKPKESPVFNFETGKGTKFTAGGA